MSYSWQGTCRWAVLDKEPTDELFLTRNLQMSYSWQGTCRWAILDKEPTDELVPFSNLKVKPLTAKYVHQVWHKKMGSSYYSIQQASWHLAKALEKLLLFCNTRKEDTALNRLHIGHFYFTHSFLLKKEEPPVRVACNTTITVKDIDRVCWFGGS